jgi:hypothetical protein
MKLNFTTYGRLSKDPSFLKKNIVFYLSFIVIGSNYPKNLYDPTRWKPKDYYLELGTAQKDWEEARAKARAQRSEVLSLLYLVVVVAVRWRMCINSFAFTD